MPLERAMREKTELEKIIVEAIDSLTSTEWRRPRYNCCSNWLLALLNRWCSFVHVHRALPIACVVCHIIHNIHVAHTASRMPRRFNVFFSILSPTSFFVFFPFLHLRCVRIDGKRKATLFSSKMCNRFCLFFLHFVECVCVWVCVNGRFYSASLILITCSTLLFRSTRQPWGHEM